MHWLTGSSPKTSLNKLRREVGALNDTVNVYNHYPFLAFEYPQILRISYLRLRRRHHAGLGRAGFSKPPFRSAKALLGKCDGRGRTAITIP